MERFLNLQLCTFNFLLCNASSFVEKCHKGSEDIDTLCVSGFATQILLFFLVFKKRNIPNNIIFILYYDLFYFIIIFFHFSILQIGIDGKS